MPRAEYRPEGWGPEWYLAWLLAHPTVGVNLATSVLAGEWRVREDALRNETRAWRHSVPGYMDALAEIRPRTAAGRPNLDDRDPTADERFLVAYRATHNRKKAAEAAGVAWETIRKRWTVRDPQYDKGFVEKLEEIDAEIVETARGALRSSLELLAEAVEDGDIKYADPLARHATTVLERREPQNWAKQQVIHGTMNTTHLHLNVDARREALARAVDVSQIAAPPLRELPAAPEPVTIDLPVREAAEA